jgi:hypothetical protein
MAPPAVWKYILDILYELLTQGVEFTHVLCKYGIPTYLFIYIFYLGITNNLCFPYEPCNANLLNYIKYKNIKF